MRLTESDLDRAIAWKLSALERQPEAAHASTEVGSDDGHEPGMQALVWWGLSPLMLVMSFALIAVFA